MNTFNFFLSALCLASAASSAATEASEGTKVEIPDNYNHVLKLGTCDKEAEITVAIEGKDTGLPYLYPKFDKDDTIVAKASQTDIAQENLGAVTHQFPGHFQIADHKFKVIKFTGIKKTNFEVYVIPPNVPAPADGEKSTTTSFAVKVDFKCDNAANEKAPKKYDFIVSNDARVVSLVSSAAVLAATFFLIL
ncbi:hypothetical protein DSO57_1038382 [Entomophthora muscae]|uniref:Uncharacterized protein n=1 Tax=Entomophthora muscae TaxID=34485 RepID=A0ACC2S0V7_9FUNG|nr:hypothetical protein DSO57_1038382 [Entomophthora muscae]